jgi:hypothetical protein
MWRRAQFVVRMVPQNNNIYMAWLWDSWEEYVYIVRPVVMDNPLRWRMSHADSWFQTQHSLYKAVTELQEKSHALHQLGFKGGNDITPAHDEALVDQARPVVRDTVYAGEELLLYHKRLAKSKASYGFLHQHGLPDYWHRYAQTHRIIREINQFVSDVTALLDGFDEMIQAEDEFIIGSVELPAPLDADFRLARNLFSVGFDEVGLLISGRGLEGVLRKIADVRKISMVAKGKSLAASEVDLYDLIEAMYQLRWKAQQTRLISPETKALLHYLRILRNKGAHHATGTRSVVNLREKAVLVAETANRLWSEVAGTKARLDPKVVQKTW